MLDIRATAYVSPVSEVEFASVPLTVRIANLADETGLVTGRFRVYNDTTGLLIHTSDIAPFSLATGATSDVSALTDFDPPAPADDVYFVIFDGHAANDLVPRGIDFALGAFHFDVKPVGMGPAPAAHHATHENGGSDELDITGLTGNPDPHKTTHENGGSDELEVSDLGTAELDDTLVLSPDGAGGVQFSAVPSTEKVGFYDETDMMMEVLANTVRFRSWYRYDVSSGTTAMVTPTANHPGIEKITSSVNANSGSSFRMDRQSILIAGGESAEFVVRPQTLAGTTIRAGFGDTQSSADMTDGVYLEMAQVGGIDGVIVGKTASNSARSTTATSYTLVTNTWYRLKVQVNAAATLVTYTLYSEAGAVLWTDTLNTNIPTGAGRQCGMTLIATNSGVVAVDLADVDFMSLWIARAFVR